MIIFGFDRYEKIVGNSPFPSMFSKGFLPRTVKKGDCVVMSECVDVTSISTDEFQNYLAQLFSLTHYKTMPHFDTCKI